jgi:hypothetical protein
VSVAVPPDVPGQPAPFCALCGRPMQADQEWCLECGAARTVIARPPDWRVPILVIGAVVLLIAGLLVFAISELGGNRPRITVVTTVAARPTSTIGTWQTGLDGYTVLLAAEPSRATAEGEATRLLAGHVRAVGVLKVSQHPQVRFKGPWLVYTGRYPSFADAEAAAGRIARHGQPLAKPALVQRAGQG